MFTYLKNFLINFFSQSWDIFLETTGSLSSPNPESQTQTEGTIFLRQLLKTVSAWLLLLNWPVTNRLVSRWLPCLSWLITNQESSFVHRQAKCEWWKEPSLSFFFFFKVIEKEVICLYCASFGLCIEYLGSWVWNSKDLFSNFGSVN